MSAETLALPAAEDSTSAAGSRRVQVRATLARLWASARVVLVLIGRSLLVIGMVIRVGLCWTAWAEGTGIARRKTVHKSRLSRTEDGKRRREHYTVERLTGVPRIKRWEVTPHAATILLKVPTGKALHDLEPAMAALRHTAGAQQVAIREVKGKPRLLAVDILHRDPLDKVALVPRPESVDRFRVACDQHGRMAAVDFAQSPHWLITGANGSGKSGWQLALLAALAATDDVLLGWDLKWGLEAQVMAPRLSGLATSREQVKADSDALIELAGQRAGLLAQLNCRNVHELYERHGVQLRRVRVLCDEVAELGLDTTESEVTAEAVLSQLLRITQLVRALGINVVVCGQRFGADMGKKITSIRAQLGGRIVCRVHDRETASMSLPGMGEDILSAAMGLDRPGLALVKRDGEHCDLQRPPYLSFTTARCVAAQHAAAVIPLHQVHADDCARLAHLLPDAATAPVVPETALITDTTDPLGA